MHIAGPALWGGVGQLKKPMTRIQESVFHARDGAQAEWLPPGKWKCSDHNQNREPRSNGIHPVPTGGPQRNNLPDTARIHCTNSHPSPRGSRNVIGLDSYFPFLFPLGVGNNNRCSSYIVHMGVRHPGNRTPGEYLHVPWSFAQFGLPRLLKSVWLGKALPQGHAQTTGTLPTCPSGIFSSANDRGNLADKQRRPEKPI